MKNLFSILTAVMLWPLVAAWAQLGTPNEQGVTMGQIHTIVQDMETTKRFWQVMGGTPIKVGGTEVMKFPGVLVFLTPGKPSAGTEGSALDHVGFWVRGDAVAVVTKLKAIGTKMSPDAGTRDPAIPMVGYVYSPDGLKIEVMEARMPLVEARMEPVYSQRLATWLQTSPSAFDHLDNAVLGPLTEFNAWYMKNFGATPFTLNGRNGPQVVIGLAGTRILAGTRKLYDNSQTDFAPTKGRTLDYFGFEVKNLQSFCKKLAAQGVKFDGAYSKSRHKSFASAEITDPWGRSIELTEGLNRF